MYTEISVKCLDQTLQLTNVPKIASRGQAVNRMTFEFCSKWDGLAKTAVFKADRSEEVYGVVLTDDVAIVPAEVTREAGAVLFGVFGVDADEAVVRTSELLQLTVVEGAFTTDWIVSAPPTADVYEQLLDKVAHACEQADQAVATADAAEAKAAEAGTAAGTAAAEAVVANKLDLTGGTITGPLFFRDPDVMGDNPSGIKLQSLGSALEPALLFSRYMSMGATPDGSPVTAAIPLLNLAASGPNGACELFGNATSATTLLQQEIAAASEATETGVFRVSSGDSNGMPTTTNGYLLVQFVYTYTSGTKRYMRFAMNLTSFAFYRSGDSGTPSWVEL